MLDAPIGDRYFRLRLKVVLLLLSIGVAGLSCARPLPDPVPIADPDTLASRLRSMGTPKGPELIEFRWRYRGHQGRFSGEGAVRFNPPDSVRLDLLGPGWSGLQSAVMLGDRTYYIGEQQIDLPPPTLLWALFGVFSPPRGVVPEGSKRGDRSELAYQLSTFERIVFAFDVAGRLIGAERRVRGRAVQAIEVKPGGSDETGWDWPRETRYRDIGEFNEVRVEVTDARDHAPFDSHIFDVTGD